jgi:bifunctional non-homologous end joining protein LigD
VFVDVARNAYAQTAVAPYSVRARPQAPIEWVELEDSRLGPQRYTIRNIFRRLARKRDPWAEIERHARPLHAAQERLGALAA